MEPAWIQGYSGCNVTVAVVDDGNLKNKSVFRICQCTNPCRTGYISRRLVGQCRKYSGTSDKGPSEIGTTSLQRTLFAAPC